MQCLLFSVLSVARWRCSAAACSPSSSTPPPSNVDSLIGELAMPQERLSPGVVGRVEVRGSSWSARNTSNVTLDPGQRARVAAIDGLTLAVVPSRVVA